MPAASPLPGFGLGLRTAHYQDFLNAPQRVDWLEIVTDNFLIDGGKPLVVLDTLRRDYPIAMHGVAMSIGSAGGLDLDYLARVKRLARRIEPMWVSDHLCWTGSGAQVLHDLFPMPYTEESARRIIAQIRQAQDVLERRLVLENVSSYVRFSASTETEQAFLAYVLEEADCELLLDVNNVYVSSVNHGFSAEEYLNALPVARVRQMHLAGHTRSGGHLIDTHDQPVAPEVWALYSAACRRFPHVATMIERDDHIPPLASLIEELDQARTLTARALADPDATPAGAPALAGSWRSGAVTLDDTQRSFAACILGEAPDQVPAQVALGGPLPGLQGMRIYHRAYRLRLTEVLADSYPKCQQYLGDELFGELALRFIQANPPLLRHLGRYGEQFPGLLQSAYPDNTELFELGQLEWALRAVFDGADVPAWTADDIRRRGVGDCLEGWPILHPSVQFQAVSSNVVPIWRAIAADEAVPEALRGEVPRVLAVWRKGLQPHFKTLDAQEAAFLQELQQDDATIAQVAQAWAESGRLPDPVQLGSWMAAWWEDELLRSDTHLAQLSGMTA